MINENDFMQLFTGTNLFGKVRQTDSIGNEQRRNKEFWKWTIGCILTHLTFESQSVDGENIVSTCEIPPEYGDVKDGYGDPASHIVVVTYMPSGKTILKFPSDII